METYSFRRATVADLTMVRRWLETPAVREWWVEADGRPSDPIEEDDLNDPHMAMWIVSYMGNPFAFIQDYDPHAWLAIISASCRQGRAASTSSSVIPI